MRLYERFADKGYHTSVATTFGIDFDAYETIVLSRLRGAGCRNNMVITDSRMLSHALGGASDLPQHAGTRYTVSGTVAAGVFHPKLYLQFGRRGGRLIISSANLTPSGLAGNLELIGMISCNDSGTGEQQLIAQAWDYVAGLIDEQRQSVSDQREWMQVRTPWLRSAIPATGPVRLRDGTLAALLITDQTTGIGERFAGLIDEPVSRLIVISPYWDPNLAALSDLTGRLAPINVSVLLDPETREFPKDAVGRLNGIRLYGRDTFRKGRFIHAKAIIAQTESADHMLLGSANCTRAALGIGGFAGANEEVCLYRRLPPESVLGLLGLTGLLTDERIIDPAELESPLTDDDLPLDELAAQAPGQFECRGDTLIWHPPTIDDPAACKVALLDRRAIPIACQLTKLTCSRGMALRYQITGTGERPVFAQVTFPDMAESVPAIVTQIDSLRMEIREPHSSSTRSKLEQLENDTEAGLELLDVLGEIEKMEGGETAASEPLSIPKRRKDQLEPDPSRYQTLSYQDFINGRRPRTKGIGAAYSSLAASDVSIVRGILNRIIGLNADDDHNDYDVRDDQHDFDLGDETADPEGDLARGGEFNTQKTRSGHAESAEDRRRRHATQRRATQDQIVKAVEKFQRRVKERQNSSALINNDLLRLRTLLMVLCTAALPTRRGEESENELRSRLRVLSVEGHEHSWPMVMGRLLFGFFGGNSPAIRQLHLTNEHDQIPGDFNECWATSYWCFQACLQAPLSRPERKRIETFLRPVARTACLLTLPSRDELLGENVIELMDRMSESYAGRLCIDPAAITNGHRAMVEELFAERTKATSLTTPSACRPCR